MLKNIHLQKTIFHIQDTFFLIWSLLSKNNLPGGAKVCARLVGPLVRTGLQSNQPLTSAQLLLGEVATVLLGGSWPQIGAPPFWVLVGGATNCEDRCRHQRDVLVVPEIGGLEEVHVGHAVFHARFLESEKEKLFWNLKLV